MPSKTIHTALLTIGLATALVLAGCAGQPAKGAQEPTPDQVEDFTPVVSATGVILPIRWATISLPSGGVIQEVLVSEGDTVETGQVLIRIGGSEALEAAVAAARLELVSAQQDLNRLHEQAELARAQAQLDLANARDELRDSEYDWRAQQEGFRADQDVLNATKANLILAEDEVERAQKEFNKVSGRRSDDPGRALALSNLSAAKQKRDSIQRQLNWLTGSPTEIQQGILDAEVAKAQAQVADAEQAFTRVENGPDTDALALAEARLANAEAQLKSAETALADLELRAPFSGMVSELYVRANEWGLPGQAALLLADLSRFHVETTDLNEIDVAQIGLNNSATVTFDAFPDLVVMGKVTRIAPKASSGSGVNYTVVVELEESPENLRWDMTAFVDIEIDR